MGKAKSQLNTMHGLKLKAVEAMMEKIGKETYVETVSSLAAAAAAMPAGKKDGSELEQQQFAAKKEAAVKVQLFRRVVQLLEEDPDSCKLLGGIIDDVRHIRYELPAKVEKLQEEIDAIDAAIEKKEEEELKEKRARRKGKRDSTYSSSGSASKKGRGSTSRHQ